MKPEDCPALDECYKVKKIVLDKDLLDFQYAEAIRTVCAACSGIKERNNAGERDELNIMATKTLTVELSEDLYNRFIETVTEREGRWREEEPSTQALESAVTAALMLFLQNLDGDTGLPEFRDYILEKYPEVDEDLVTMIEDLIERQRERVT